MFAILAVCSLCWIVRVLDRQVRRILWIINWNIIMYFFFLFDCSCARGLGSDGLCGSGRSNPGAQGGFGHLQPAARKPTRLLVADSWAKEINRIDTDQEDSSARKKSDRFVPNSLPGCAQDRDDPVSLTGKNCCVVGGQYYGNTFPHQSPRLSLLQPTCWPNKLGERR